jgi:hypothetical protein
MATAPTIDDLFPSGKKPEAPAQKQKPAFYPKAPAPKGGSDSASPTTPKETTVDDLFPSGGPPEPTTGDMATSVAKGAAKGALRDSPIVAGALTGFRVGMPMVAPATPFMGPFAAAIPFATTALGGYFGYEAGQAASGVIPEEEDPRLKAYFEGGTTFGSSLATAPVTFGLPIAGPTAGRVATFLSTMGKAARSSPKVFMGSEAVSAATQGIAGGTAEAYRPGQEGVRLTAELAAGVSPVSKLLTLGVDASKTALSAIKAGFAGRSASLENKAANLLLDALEKSGEDPEALLKALRQQMPKGVPTPTSGQKTGSKALMDLESSLGNHRAQFGSETTEQGRTAMLAYQELIEALGKTGPEGLIAASKLRYDRFVNGLETRLSLADANAARKIAKINTESPEARTQVGMIVKDQVERALTEARDVESKLWTSALEDLTRPVKENVKKDVVIGINQFNGKEITKTITETRIRAPGITPSNTVDTFLARASEMGPALFNDIPPQVRNIMKSFNVDEAAVAKFRQGKLTDEYLSKGKIPDKFLSRATEQPVQDLVSYRSTLLKMARDAAGSGQRSNAEFYSSLADGMLQDLNTLKDPMYDQAREFSRALNDTFTRTYAGNLTAVTSTGRPRVPAETLVQNAFGGSAGQTALRMKEVEDSVTFLRTQYREAVAKFGKDSPRALELKPFAVAATGNVASVRDAHNRVLRLAAAKALKVVPGSEPGTFVQELKFDKLTEFAQQNSALLERLGLMGELRDAAHAANLLTQVTKETSALSRTADNQRAFAKLLTAESPIKVISDSLNGRFPVRDIRALAELAKKGGPDAVEGFKSSLYDYAYMKAGGNSPGADAKFSIDAYTAALFDPISRNQPSIANIMRANGMLTLQELSNFKKLLVPMARIETAIKNKIPVEDVIQGADAVTELGLRIIGANIGSKASAGAGGGVPLIAAAAGSKAVRQIFDALPNATVRVILENAVRDPDAMALLLAKGRTEKEKRDIANGVINLLGSFGVSVGKSAVTPALNYINAPQEEKPVQTSPLTPQGEAYRQLRMLPKAPNTRGVPGLMDTAPKPPGQTGDSGAPTKTNANARAQYQSLFPFDSVSPMVGGQLQPQK